MSYRVIFAGRVDEQLLKHVGFLARVSVPAAKAFRTAFAGITEQLSENPYQFPVETDSNLPQGMYRKALFARRYKVLFCIDKETVCVDAVVDCRQDSAALYRELH